MKKVNSRVNIDEKTGKMSTSANIDCDLSQANEEENNIDDLMTQKFVKLQPSNSLPDLQSEQVSSSSAPSSTGTISSNSNNNNQIQSPGSGHGQHVILAVEAQDDEGMNQIGGCDDNSMAKKKIKMNIASNGSSSSTSSNNLEYVTGGASMSTL